MLEYFGGFVQKSPGSSVHHTEHDIPQKLFRSRSQFRQDFPGYIPPNFVVFTMLASVQDTNFEESIPSVLSGAILCVFRGRSLLHPWITTGIVRFWFALLPVSDGCALCISLSSLRPVRTFSDSFLRVIFCFCRLPIKTADADVLLSIP